MQAIVRREATALGASVETDVLGSTVARVAGKGGGRLVALFAHADQIGMVVRGVGDDGLLTVAKLGSWRPQDALGQRARIVTSVSEVRGVVAAPHDVEITWDALRVDIGAADREEALGLVGPGDGIVLDGPPETLPNGRVLSGALDDRIGIFAGLEVLRSLAVDPAAWDVALAVTVQEETSHGGARVVAERLAPDVAIIVDVTYAGDAPGTAPWGDVRLGGGPTVFRGPVVSPVVGDGLLEAAALEGIEVAVESGDSTWSDADDIFAAGGGGVACQIVCIPMRYMHTAGEIVQLSDVTETARLLEAYIRSLAPDSSFLR